MSEGGPDRQNRLREAFSEDNRDGRYKDFDDYLQGELRAYQDYKEDFARRQPDPSFRLVMTALIVGATLIFGVAYLLRSLGYLPLLAGLVLVVAAVVGAWVASELRCPSCRRHFARSSKTFVATDHRKPVYRVACRFCGHRWWTWQDT